MYLLQPNTCLIFYDTGCILQTVSKKKENKTMPWKSIDINIMSL